MTKIKVKPAKSMKGEILIGGDKSISHRAAIISAMATGETRIENFSPAADCASTLSCLESLGVTVKRDGSTIVIGGVGKTGFRPPTSPLDCGNSGTTMRLLAGVLAGQPFTSILIGDDSLSTRPMKRVIEPLSQMGAVIDAEGACAPLKIKGKSPLQAITFRPETASAQVKSCVLLAGLNAEGTTTLVEPISTRDHTERMLRWFGVDVFAGNDKITVSGRSNLKAKYLQVPADVSSAAFFIVAASCLAESDLILKNVGLNPSRTAILDVLSALGANIEIFNKSEACNEPVGDMRVCGGLSAARPASNKINGATIANLIDEIPVLAVFGTQASDGVEVRDAAELRVKESDRIAAVVTNLRLMNADIEQFPDGFRVCKSSLRGAKLESFGDHRIAMAFSVAGLLAEGETEIKNADIAAVSFPTFFRVLETVAI
jgi:3-phosphoshikimate 1-carboxyvinyltransferase